jgi:hypothetical protein
MWQSTNAWLCKSVSVFRISRSALISFPSLSPPTQVHPPIIPSLPCTSPWVSSYLCWKLLVFLLTYIEVPLSRPWKHDIAMTTWLQLGYISVKITIMGSVMINKSQPERIVWYSTDQWTKLQCSNCYKMGLNESYFSSVLAWCKSTCHVQCDLAMIKVNNTNFSNVIKCALFFWEYHCRILLSTLGTEFLSEL